LRTLAVVAVAVAACAPRPGEAPNWADRPLPSPGAISVIDVRLSGPEENALQAAVVTQGSAERALLRCRVRRGSDRLAEAETQFAPAGTSLTSFRLWRETGWPPGDYTVEIELDGRIASTREMQVRAGS
jgi:hypothetical protein